MTLPTICPIPALIEPERLPGFPLKIIAGCTGYSTGAQIRMISPAYPEDGRRDKIDIRRLCDGAIGFAGTETQKLGFEVSVNLFTRVCSYCSSTFSIVKSVKENGRNPYAYLNYLFAKLPNLESGAAGILDQLLPWNVILQ